MLSWVAVPIVSFLANSPWAVAYLGTDTEISLCYVVIWDVKFFLIYKSCK
jgi:hypothetical protein